MDDLGISTSKQIISTLDYRGARILLPEIISKIAGFDENEDVEITANEQSVKIKKLNIK